VEHCVGCGASLADVAIEQELARQVHEIPPMQVRVSEHL
jgi:hypothetical protein